MSGKSILLAVTAGVAFSSTAVAQQTTFFETAATRAGVPGFNSAVNFQYPILGPQAEAAPSGAFAPAPPRSPDGSRLLADGLITRSAADGGVMNRISASLAANDADVFQIRVTDAAAFSAQIGTINTSGVTFGVTTSLFLFDETGQAIRGGSSRLNNGATADVNEAAKVTLTLPPAATAGLYWIGISRNVNSADFTNTDIVVPRNASGEKLFDESLLLANPGTVYDVLGGLSSTTLSTDRTQSWQVTPFDDNTLNPADPGVRWTTNATPTPISASIFLTGAQYVVVPEPTSMLAAGALGATLLRRRSR